MEYLSAPMKLSQEMADDFVSLVKSFSPSYFNIADVDSLVNTLTVKKEIKTINEVLSLVNISDSDGFKRYDKYSAKRDSLIRLQLKLETSLRINVASRREIRDNSSNFEDNTNRNESKDARFNIVNKDIWDN